MLLETGDDQLIHEYITELIHSYICLSKKAEKQWIDPFLRAEWLIAQPLLKGPISISVCVNWEITFPTCEFEGPIQTIENSSGVTFINSLLGTG